MWYDEKAMRNGIVETYIKQRAQAHLERRRERLAARSGLTGAKARQAEIVEAVRAMLAPWPERTPLKEQTVRRREREGIVVEVLTYESLPGVVVPANLYRPSDPGEAPGNVAKRPGVVCLTGPEPEGKAHSDYQRLGQLLARHGMAALILDPLGQGERVQFYDVTLRRSWLGHSAALERTLLGNVLALSGHHLGACLAWDAMRGLDLLAQRAGVDAARLGVAGAGLGATVARYLACVDERLAAAVAVPDEADLDPLGGGEAERCLIGALARGIAPLDLWCAFAPKPLLLARGAHQHAKKEPPGPDAAGEEIGAWYQRFGARERFEMFESGERAVFSKPRRAQSVAFLARAFGLPGSHTRETDMPFETPGLLNATETGQVANSLSGVDLFAYHRRCARGMPPPLPAPPDAAAARQQQETIRARIRTVLRMPEPAEAVQEKVEGRSSDWGLAVEKGRLIVEDGIYLPYSFYTEPETAEGTAARPTVLALHERGLSAIAAQGPWMRRLAGAGFHIMAMDVRGTGQTRLQPPRSDGEPYPALLLGPEAQWARRALGVGLNLFGGRVFDILRTLQHLRTRWDVQAERLSLVGVGRGALWALYAAALDEKVERAVLVRGLSTYASLVEHRRQNLHFSLFLPGVLKEFDLPHAAACVAPRPLTLLNAVNQRRERPSAEQTRQLYTFPQECYRRLDAPGALQIVTTDHPGETLRALAQGLGLAPDGDWSE